MPTANTTTKARAAQEKALLCIETSKFDFVNAPPTPPLEVSRPGIARRSRIAAIYRRNARTESVVRGHSSNGNRRNGYLPSNTVFCRLASRGVESCILPRRELTMQKNPKGDLSPVIQPPDRMPEERLDSWKEIAAYLNRDVTTVQRWEKREGMPVHRHLHDRMGSVYAFRAELDAWAHSRNLPAAQENGNNLPSPNPPALPPRATRWTSLTRWTVVLPLAAGAALAIGASLWLQRTEYFWRSPIADARFQTVTEFDGVEQAAALSRDGHFVAFLSDRDGQMDVWVTQVGSGLFHNLTRGSAPELVNPSVRTLGFSQIGR